MLLSILIPTLASREALRLRLLEQLLPQIEQADGPGERACPACTGLTFRWWNRVELILLADDGELSIGAKRNQLMGSASGEYVCMFDDDDLPGPGYVREILRALEARPDCVGFRVRRFSDGKEFGESINSLSCTPLMGVTHKRIELPGGRVIYPRTPNHLNPVRRDLATRCTFPNQNFAEDASYAGQLLPHLRTEVFVNEFLYDYLYRTPLNREGERTNA